MSAKRHAINLKIKLENLGIEADFVPVIKDKYVVHHDNLGGVGYLYLKDPARVGDAIDIVKEIPGVEQMYRREEAVEQFGLMPERIGDLFVLGTPEVVFGDIEGEEQAIDTLLQRYRHYARAKARSYFLAGADREDIVQEGMIGLYKAIRDFQAERQSSFRAFAELCITRQIITAIKSATRQKHIPLNSYVSLNRPVSHEDGEQDRVLVDVLATHTAADPVELVISSEEDRSMQTSFSEILSDLEAHVLHLYLEGKSYQEIAAGLKRHVKSIDNALQRIKRKVEAHMDRRRVAG